MFYENVIRIFGKRYPIKNHFVCSSTSSLWMFRAVNVFNFCKQLLKFLEPKNPTPRHGLVCRLGRCVKPAYKYNKRAIHVY